jgi:hypothetical protein
MKHFVLSMLLTSAAVFPQPSPQEKREGFRPMCNGKDLTGWDGDPQLWKVQGGVVVGSTEGVTLKANSFLISKKEYSDFILRTDIRLRNHNSGIQFRSEALPDYVVRGLQCDMAENNYWGSIYDERGKRGIIINGWKDKAEKVVKNGDWNSVEIYAKGEDIRITINGLVTAELKDSSKLSGIIAFQVHRGPAMQVEFRNTRIKELK